MEALNGALARSSTDEPLVSIVMPVRDWRQTTAAAVRSILSQSYTCLELLLIGQRPLGTLPHRLQSLQLDDKRIRLVPRRTPGIVGALNTGLQAAQGDYIARMDDDDIAYSERIAQQLSYLNKHPDIGLCAGRVRFIDESGGCARVKPGNQHYAQWLNELIAPDAIAHACYAENPMPHPTLFAHRTVWSQLGGYREGDGPEDHDLVLRAMLQGIGMGKPPEVLLDWREHDNRITHTDTRYRRDAFVNCSAWALTSAGGRLHATRRSVWIAGTGKQARHWHDALIAQGVTVAGFVDMDRPGPERSKRKKPVITYQQLATTRSNELVISAVTQASGRVAIRTFFEKQYWREGDDYIMGC